MNTPISVAFASDDVTAMPMTVAIASLLATRRPDTAFDIHVLSCGISARARRHTETTIAELDGSGSSARLFWHDITGANATLLQRFYTDSDRSYPPANYARLLVGQFLPPEAERVIYIDIDTAVLTDLTPLWETPFDGSNLLAVRDLPHDNGQTDRLLSLIDADMQTRYGLKSDHVYFQAGMLVLDLNAFRTGLIDEITAVLPRYPELKFPDQDALNIVLTQRHRLLDPRWNSMTAIYWYENADASPYDAELFRALQEEPYIVHYSGRPKPWEPGCKHPLAYHWTRFHAMTPWAARRITPLTRALDRIPRARRKLGKKMRRLLRL